MKTRAKKSLFKKIVIIFSLLLLLFSLVSMIVVKIMYDDNFKRAEKMEHRFSAYLYYEDIQDKYDREIIDFYSGKNKLTGYIYGQGQNQGLVVISHGLGGGAESYLAEVMYFVDQGWTVFAFDNTGSHESEGKGTIGLAQSVIDLDSALSYVENDSQLKDLPIMLYGHSWGGYAVTSILNYDHDINASVSIAGFNSPFGLLMEQAKSMMGFFAYIESPFLWAYQSLLFRKAASMTAVDGINSSDTPVMIIHGDEDDVILYEGASIISHKDEITNPNVIFKTCSEVDHNGHNNLFASVAAMEYINGINEEYLELYNQYNGEIPDEIRAKFYEGIDRYLTEDLDAEFIDDINEFFKAALYR